VDVHAVTDRIIMVGNAITYVRPCVCFHSVFRSNWPLTLTFCMYMVHAHSFPEFESQGQRSRSTLTPTPDLNSNPNAVILTSILDRGLFSSWVFHCRGIFSIWLADSGGILAWFSVCGEVQICTWSSWCHCHSISLATVNPDWFYLPGFTFLVLAHLGNSSQSPGGQ